MAVPPGSHKNLSRRKSACGSMRNTVISAPSISEPNQPTPSLRGREWGCLLGLLQPSLYWLSVYTVLKAIFRGCGKTQTASKPTWVACMRWAVVGSPVHWDGEQLRDPHFYRGHGRQRDTGSYNLHQNLRITMRNQLQHKLCTGPFVITITVVAVVVGVVILAAVTVTAAHSMPLKWQFSL